jgi:hypothetical protein
LLITIFNCLPVYELDIDEWIKNVDQVTRIYFQGLGHHPSELRREGFVSAPDYIFIRNDGWSMGCYEAELEEAYSLWAQEWVAVYKRSY